MRPWDIIGWMVLAVVVFVASRAMMEVVAGFLVRRYLHLRTRNIAPRVGQVWVQDNDRLYINAIYENGRIGVLSTAPPGLNITRSGWGDTPEEWRNRVRNRRLWLARSA